MRVSFFYKLPVIILIAVLGFSFAISPALGQVSEIQNSCTKCNTENGRDSNGVMIGQSWDTNVHPQSSHLDKVPFLFTPQSEINYTAFITYNIRF